MTTGFFGGLLADAIAAAESAGLRYAVMGGFAVMDVNGLGVTFDTDLLLDADQNGLTRFGGECVSRGIKVPRDHRAGWVDRIRIMAIARKHDLPSGLRPQILDVFAVGAPISQWSLSRLGQMRIPGREVPLPIVSRADLSLLKLMAGRLEDLVYVRNYLALEGVPDPYHFRGWARAFDVESLVDRLIEEGRRLVRPT